ncbi:MAG: hypothetical protein IT422_04905 [Pirellulaceae bacterium]|nr:hypothetical protein [Pirellulaceae bacterium]
MMQFDFHGVGLSAEDFKRDLKGWVAFSIAFTLNAHCRNKEAALEILEQAAEDIIQQVKTGKAPE